MEKNLIEFLLDLQMFADPNEDDDLLDIDDFDEDDEEDNDSEESDEKKEQSRKKNAEEARKRREKEQKEREEKIRKEAIEEGKRLAKRESLKINEFTGEPIESDFDLEAAEIMRKIKDRGGDPIKEFPKEYGKIVSSRKADEDKKQKEKKDREDWEKQDRQKFAKKVGGSNKAIEILKDESFRTFAKGRIGVDDLTEIYDDFKKFMSKYQASENKDSSSTPSGSGTASKMTKKVADMDDKEYEEYFRKKYNA